MPRRGRTPRRARRRRPRVSARSSSVRSPTAPGRRWRRRLRRSSPAKSCSIPPIPIPGATANSRRAAIAAGEGAGVPVARLLPGARLVRAFNSVYFKTLETEAHRAGDRVGIPLAGDDAAALDAAARLVRDAGFEPVVVGAARQRAPLRSGDAGLQHRHERRRPRPRARRRPFGVTRTGRSGAR